MNDRLLSIYLNDHLAGATAGVELARRTARNNEGTRYAEELDRLAGDIEDDRASLHDLMKRLGFEANLLKDAAAWMGEKVGRLKLNGQLTGYSPLSRLIEMETLSLGIEGKVSLWENLLAIAGEDSRLETAELEKLRDRARSQFDVVRRLRKEAATEALG